MNKLKIILPIISLSSIGIIATPLVSCSCSKEKDFDSQLLEKYVGCKVTSDCKIMLSSEESTPADLKYSLDGNNWTNFAPNTGIDFKSGTILYLKGNNSNGFSYLDSESKKHTNKILISTGEVVLAGNIIGLINDGSGTIPDTLPAYCFYRLFNDSVGITNIDKLVFPSKVSKNIYSHLFDGCVGIKSIPEKFFKITDLSGGDNCYTAMFAKCTGLTKLPKDIFSATKLSKGCYQNMFNSCTNLTYSPDLEIESLEGADECYYELFAGCTSLVIPPKIKAKTLSNSCFKLMFAGCTSLASAPELIATELKPSCYYGMFYYCINLKEINVNFSTWGENDECTGWVDGVGKSGEFVCPSALPEARDISKMPTGWTITRK